MSPFERKRRRWWLMVWPDDNARSVHNRDPKRKARDIMKVVEVVPAYELRGAVEDSERMRLALRALLDKHGCECGVCVDAEHAIPAHTTGGQ